MKKILNYSLALFTFLYALHAYAEVKHVILNRYAITSEVTLNKNDILQIEYDLHLQPLNDGNWYFGLDCTASNHPTKANYTLAGITLKASLPRKFSPNYDGHQKGLDIDPIGLLTIQSKTDNNIINCSVFESYDNKDYF